MEREIAAFLTELQNKESVSNSTQLAYANDLRIFLAYLEKSLNRPVQVKDLEFQQIAGFLEAEKAAGRKRATLTRRVVTLKRFIRFLSSQGLLEDPLLSDSVPSFQSVLDEARMGQHPQCLSADQIASLLKAMNKFHRPRAVRDQAILMLSLETAISVGQLTALDLSDLDLSNSLVYITLNENNHRWFPMGEARSYVERYLREGRPELIQDSRETALFISQKDGRLSRQGIWQILNHWGRLVDPPITLSPRLLRHTAVQHMLRRGRSITEIQVLLGHRNPLSTRALVRRLQAACHNTGEPFSLINPGLRSGFED